MSQNKVLPSQLATSAIGPTFAGSAITITATNTWFTAVTLGSALTNGGVYDIKGVCAVRTVGTAPSDMTVQIFDSTNSVVIWGGTTEPETLNEFRLVTIPGIRYSGFAGTPTIIMRVMNDGGTANAIMGGYLDTTGSIINGKTTFIQAELVG